MGKHGDPRHGSILYYTGLGLIFRLTRNNFQKYSTTRNALKYRSDIPRPIIFCYDTHIVLRTSSWKYFKCVPPRRLSAYIIYIIHKDRPHICYTSLNNGARLWFCAFVLSTLELHNAFKELARRDLLFLSTAVVNINRRYALTLYTYHDAILYSTIYLQGYNISH